MYRINYISYSSFQCKTQRHIIYVQYSTSKRYKLPEHRITLTVLSYHLTGLSYHLSREFSDLDGNFYTSDKLHTNTLSSFLIYHINFKTRYAASLPWLSICQFVFVCEVCICVAAPRLLVTINIIY